MTRFSNLRARLVGTVLLAITPAWMLMYFTDLPWAGFALGLVALTAAWFGGERFVIRQVRALLKTTDRLAAGDLSSRTGMGHEHGEWGRLAQQIDTMAANLEQRVRDREQAERTLLNRSLQQTVISALGQFALVSDDLDALFNQAVLLTGQTLEVDYCGVFEHQPVRKTLLLRAGSGWKQEQWEESADTALLPGFSLRKGEPVVVEDFTKEARFQPGPNLSNHGVLSCVSVTIPAPRNPFGILGAFSTRPRRYSEDEIQFVLAVGTVLTMAVQRAQAETQMRKLAAFARLNPNPALELDTMGHVGYANPAAEAIAAGLKLEDPKGLLPANVIVLVSECLSTGRSLRHEAKLGDRTLSWSLHPVPGSKVVHAYVEDITERLNLEQQLRQSQKMESVGQLAAGVAHDFNNMLTIIQGHSGMLLTRDGLPADTKEPVQAIAFAAERAAGLTRQLLMFSRKSVMQRKVLDLPQVVADMSKLLQRLVGEAVRIQLDCADDSPPVSADMGMLEQVLMNLVVNARDAMPKGGKITIGVRARTFDPEYTGSHPEARPGKFARIYVSDTGTGMDAETLKRIFEPFFTTKEVGKGTGLGLATVYGIVKQHNGWVDVTSEPGAGSRFDIYLPASDKPAAVRKDEEDTKRFASSGAETILVVEDEPALRELARAMLERLGYQVLMAGSGPEAMKVWDRHGNHIKLVITDMVMPEGMSGMDLAQQLHRFKPDLKIIIASGYSMEESETVFFAKGVKYLQKPYTHVSLSKAIRECLDQQTECSTAKAPASG